MEKGTENQIQNKIVDSTKADESAEAAKGKEGSEIKRKPGRRKKQPADPAVTTADPKIEGDVGAEIQKSAAEDEVATEKDSPIKRKRKKKPVRAGSSSLFFLTRKTPQVPHFWGNLKFKSFGWVSGVTQATQKKKNRNQTPPLQKNTGFQFL